MRYAFSQVEKSSSSSEMQLMDTQAIHDRSDEGAFPEVWRQSRGLEELLRFRRGLEDSGRRQKQKLSPGEWKFDSGGDWKTRCEYRNRSYRQENGNQNGEREELLN
ncbi:unnamed protein product [Linum trigynum]|uniref:Uncharacterized protein n=1 Tax=Linum trigynum TaxID=586398 RepID=A0AAV2GNP1_9ROSI